MGIGVYRLSKRYGQKVVWEDLNLQFKTGRVNCLMGASGSGKTTLLRLMMGLEKPDQGVITGIDREQISAVFQEDRLCRNLTVLRNILMIGTGQLHQQTVLRHLEQVGLSEWAFKPVYQLSGGMCRRVAIVRAMLAEAEVVFLDEPFTGLDETNKQEVALYMQKQIGGKTVIMVTHHLAEVELMHGEIIEI